MSTDAPFARARAVHTPHPATLPRAEAVQPKLAKELPPHPATVPRVKAVQPKLAKEPTPHPATVPRAKAVQPKLAKEPTPHPATLSLRNPIRMQGGSAAPDPARVAK